MKHLEVRSLVPATTAINANTSGNSFRQATEKPALELKRINMTYRRDTATSMRGILNSLTAPPVDAPAPSEPTAVRSQLSSVSAPASSFEPAIASIPTPVAPAICPGIATPMSLPAKAAFQSETLFDFGKALIEPGAQAAFDAFACSISEPDHDLVITRGHADTVGTAAFSQTLAEQRTNAVRVYLIGQSLDAECIRSEGRGEREPIASNSIADERMRNRRVEIEVRGN